MQMSSYYRKFEKCLRTYSSSMKADNPNFNFRWELDDRPFIKGYVIKGWLNNGIKAVKTVGFKEIEYSDNIEFLAYSVLDEICNRLNITNSIFTYYDLNKPSWRKFDTKIKQVIFNNPATIILWKDGTKTVVKCGPHDTYDPEKGLAMAIAKRAISDKGDFNELFKKWISREKALDDIPATETSGLAHGHWIRDGGWRICSHCGDRISTSREHPMYCWGCGARMDEKEK